MTRAATLGGAALLAAAAAAGAQTSREDPSDLQAWYGAGLALDLPRRWEAAFRYRVRTDHDASAYQGSYLGAELGRRVHDRVAVTGGYRLALTDEPPAHRFSLDAEASARVGTLALSLRPALQYRLRRVEGDDEQDGPGRLTFRTRLRARGRITDALDAYASAEPVVQLGDDTFVRGWRNTVGVRLEYARGRRVDLFYSHRPDYAKSYNRTFHVLGVDLDFEAAPWKRRGQRR